MNEPYLSEDPLLADPAARAAAEGSSSTVVISFSHFLPRQELCPEKRFLIEPNLTKVCSGMCVHVPVHVLARSEALPRRRIV